jgi:hypothetical protein
VCANTLVYVAWLLPAASHAPWRVGAALAWALAQLATLFVSGWSHHTPLDIVLGCACVVPQLALMCVVCA